MNAKYLLPCRCGRQMTVEPREAGRTSLCPCGQSLLIPTMLEITRLEPAPAETSLPPKCAWSWPHALLLAGIAMVVVAITLACVFRYLHRWLASTPSIPKPCG